MEPLLPKSPPLTLWDVSMGFETLEERKLRMLRPLRDTCMACTMCELGRKDAEKGNILRDPHVLSNMSPSRYVVIGQNPGWDELEACEPFVGQAGRNFDKEIKKHGRSRSDFYITNMVKCWTKGNAKPSVDHCLACSPFLDIEIRILKPKIIITLGSVSFGMLCPGVKYNGALGVLTESRFGMVYAVYHPSPMNINDRGRRVMFEEQIYKLCRLMDRCDTQKLK